MKHPARQTLMLVILFLIAQLVGISVLFAYAAPSEEGEIEFKKPRMGDLELERPDVDENISFIPLIIAIGIGTGIMLLIIRLNQVLLWKLWFILAVFFSMSISFSAFVQGIISVIAALIVAIWTVVRPNLYVHTLTELFLYSGISVVFVPLLNIFSAVMLLIVISLYDIYAVWKSKHMIKLAEFQAKSGVFAGFVLPYAYPLKKIRKRARKYSAAILGGGDVAFPMLFEGVVLKTFGLGSAIWVSIFATLALFLLLLYGKKKKFYPAMPFLSAGCFVGFILVSIV